MLSESLKERLAQYKILKEEEKLSAAPSVSLTRPEDGTLQSSTVVDPTPQDRTSDVAEQGKNINLTKKFIEHPIASNDQISSKSVEVSSC